jgi:hypothetical protein
LPVMNTGSSGFSSPGITGMGGRGVGVFAGESVLVGLLTGSPDKVLHAIAVPIKITRQTINMFLLFFTQLLLS